MAGQGAQNIRHAQDVASLAPFPSRHRLHFQTPSVGGRVDEQARTLSLVTRSEAVDGVQ